MSHLISLKFIRSIFITFILFLSMSKILFAFDLSQLERVRGDKILDVQFIGDPPPLSFKEKVLNLKRRNFNLTEVRTLLIWLNESGFGHGIKVWVRQERGGVVLVISANQRSKINQIKFEGNAAINSNQLLPLTQLGEGFEFEKEVAEEAIKKISLNYSRMGYLASDVKYLFEQSTGTLTFSIVEGQPTLLSSIELSPIKSIERKELRERYEDEILQAFGLGVGDRIEREKVLDGIQAVKDWLREHDFLLAKDPTLDYRVQDDGSVGLVLNIQYGTRIRYGFRGNQQFSYRELMALVSEVREISSGSDYLSAVRRRVLDAYREIGFANAQITTLVREDAQRGIRHISLIVSEREKIRINKVFIDGIYSMSEEDAVKKFRSLSSRLVQRNYFHEIGINQGAELFAEYLKSQGFLSAKIEFVKFDFNEEKTKVDVSLLFSEGIQTKVQEISTKGERNLTKAEISEILAVKEGEPFNIFSFERGVILLREKYQSLGLLSAQIVNEGSENFVRYSKDNSQVYLNLEVEEGPVFKVGEIIVKGNQKTHARVVIRELPFIADDILTSPLLAEAEDNLRKLNLFSSVIVRPIDRPGTIDVKDILILVDELEPGSFDIVPGYRNDLGVRLGFELGYQNLGGWNRSLNARAVFNRRTEAYRFPEYNFSIGFREPYLANWPVAFTTNLTLFNRQFSKFDANVNRITVGVKRDLTRILSGLLEYSYEKIRVSNAQLPYQVSENRTDFIGSLTPGFIIDSRNDRFNPSKGVNSSNRFEVASRFFGSDSKVGYYRFTSYNSSYFRILEDMILALALNVGWQRSNIAGQPIPTFKLFRLGGIGSIRGFSEDALEVETSRNINGILGLINTRAEVRIPLSGSVGTALFLDAGNLMVDRFSFSPGELRSAIGAGLRYNTPVGPVVLDFAWRLQSDDEVGDTKVPDVGLDRFKIHFSIGAF
jgi:outer membrane protein insertion porin family